MLLAIWGVAGLAYWTMIFAAVSGIWIDWLRDLSNWLEDIFVAPAWELLALPLGLTLVGASIYLIWKFFRFL